MDNKVVFSSIKERRKKCLDKSFSKDFLYLILPTVLVMGLFFASLYSFIISLLLVYFVLPMFYTVEKRIRAKISGIGNKNFSYKDGYKAFFVEKKGGVFGAISASLLGFSFFLLSILIVSNFTGLIFNCFPNSKESYAKVLELLQTGALNEDIYSYIFAHTDSFTRPTSVIVSLSLFLSLFAIFFYMIPDNLVNHYLATIVLPDIDNNISAAQARSLAKGSFARALFGKRIKFGFILNWPYYLSFIILYGVSTYLTSLINTNNPYLFALIIILTPTIAIFYGIFLMYMCLINDYVVIEELAPYLNSLLPEAMKISIYQAFNNPQYIHGEETAIRGSFIPNPNTYNTYYSSNSDEKHHDEAKNNDNENTTAVVDFSSNEDKKE